MMIDDPIRVIRVPTINCCHCLAQYGAQVFVIRKDDENLLFDKDSTVKFTHINDTICKDNGKFFNRPLALFVDEI